MVSRLIPKKPDAVKFIDLPKSAGILDDYAVRKNVATREGTVEKVPVNNSDIANKKYVDDAISAIPPTNPAGADTQIQFNNSGVFGASANLTWNGTVVNTSGKVTCNGIESNGASIFNESGADKDFRVEGDTDANLLFLDASTDRIGIGTATPGAKLEAVQSGVADFPVFFTAYGTGSGGGYVGRMARGTFAIPTATQTDDIIGGTFGRGYGATGFSAVSNGYVRVQASENFTNSAYGTKIAFATTPNTATTALVRMTILNNGSVGIGTTAPLRSLDINNASGNCLRLIYNDADGSAANYTDFLLGSNGALTLTSAANSFTFGNGVANTDTVLNFTGTTTSGVLTWMEDEDYFKFSDDLFMNTGEGVMFEATTTKLQYGNTGDLDVYTPANKTLELQTSVYQDANVGALVLRTGGTAAGVVQWKDNDGDDTGIYTLGFADGEQGSGSIEIPHDYKEGTNLVFHIHYGLNDAPTGTDNIRFDLIYNVQRDGTTFADAVTIDSADIAVDTQYKTNRIDFSAITGTSFKIGDQFNFTIKRTTATGDAYAGEVLAQTLGFHYEVDTMGSRTIAAK